MKRFTTLLLPVLIWIAFLACGSTKSVMIGHRTLTGGAAEVWYDSDGDGKCDYKETYVFKNGKLTPVERGDCSEF